MNKSVAQNTTPCCLVMAGGTGGHVFPALAVAELLRERGWDIAWLGGALGIENRIVPKAGFRLFALPVVGLRGKGWRTLALAPARLVVALVRAISILRRVRPQVVLGMGGFAAGPGGIAAWMLRRPLVIHEQNAVPGLTNRILARFAIHVLQAFPESFPKSRRAQTTGNPVRMDIGALASPEQRQAASPAGLRVLVIGGSQGARILNETVGLAMKHVPRDLPIKLRHQCGKGGEAVARAAYVGVEHEISIEPFIDDMAAALGWANLVVCRAGAMTISELAAAGCASILVPFPAAVDDHQTANANVLSGVGAAIHLPQPELNPQRLAQELIALSADAGRLLVMAERARALAKPQAAKTVADICEESARAR